MPPVLLYADGYIVFIFRLSACSFLNMYVCLSFFCASGYLHESFRHYITKAGLGGSVGCASD